MTEYMLIFSLGPVQSFIVQARTRDLWLGSFLLSALMQESMKGIESKLILPFDPVIKDNIPDLPNKYIAIFDDADEAAQAARESEKKIHNFWRMICEEIWHEVLAIPANSSKETRQQWDQQIEPAHVFEVFWIVVEGDREHYAEWLMKTLLAFDGRKRLREFRQQQESGEKSTISGQRSALRGRGERRSDVQHFWKRVAMQHSVRDIDKDGFEWLDAIDTVKRFAFLSASFRQTFRITEHELGSVGFPSTSSIATASFLERLILTSKTNQASPTSAIENWIRVSQQLDAIMSKTIPFLSILANEHKQAKSILTLDGACLFPETFHPQRLKKEFGFNEQRAEELARTGPTALSKLFKETDKLAITRPTSYYAMIQMDGDKVRRLINSVQSIEEHRAISQVLSTFLRTHVPSLVEQRYPGRLIYSGGDDVFALTPLARDLPAHSGETPQIRTVLDLADQLQQQYRSVVEPAVIDPVRKKFVTASTGIVITHYYTSLSYVRRVSKEAEQLAKRHYGRNALVVIVLRRSGEQTRVGCRWRYPDLEAQAQPIPLFVSFYTYFKDDVLSPTCVFQLLEEAPTLVWLDQVDENNIRVAQQSEILRVLRGHRNPAKEQDLPNERLKDLARGLVKLAQAMDKDAYPALEEGSIWSVELHADQRRYGLVEVLGWLLVMLFLARKEQE